jgi:hypothetical protein
MKQCMNILESLHDDSRDAFACLAMHDVELLDTGTDGKILEQARDGRGMVFEATSTSLDIRSWHLGVDVGRSSF